MSQNRLVFVAHNGTILITVGCVGLSNTAILGKEEKMDRTMLTQLIWLGTSVLLALAGAQALAGAAIAIAAALQKGEPPPYLPRLG